MYICIHKRYSIGFVFIFTFGFQNYYLLCKRLYLGDSSLVLINTKRDNKLDRFKISSCIEQENNTSLKKKVMLYFFHQSFLHNIIY